MPFHPSKPATWSAVRPPSSPYANSHSRNSPPGPYSLVLGLVEALLAAYAPNGANILDPFVGSGTSLVEAAHLGLPACGADLNPAAVFLSRVYEFVNLPKPARTLAIKEIEIAVTQAIGISNGPLFTNGIRTPMPRAELESHLVTLWHASDPGPARILTAALVVLCDFHQKHLNAERVHAKWLRLAKIVRNLPECPCPVVVHHADARRLPVPNGSADLVLSSPPYINPGLFMNLRVEGKVGG